jgi:hypothetical protein
LAKYGGFHKCDTPTLVVCNAKAENKMDDNWGYPHDFGNLHTGI